MLVCLYLMPFSRVQLVAICLAVFLDMPVGKDTYDLNPQLFPKGWADFKELSSYTQSRGIHNPVEKFQYARIHLPTQPNLRPRKTFNSLCQNHNRSLLRIRQIGSGRFQLKQAIQQRLHPPAPTTFYWKIFSH